MTGAPSSDEDMPAYRLACARIDRLEQALRDILARADRRQLTPEEAAELCRAALSHAA